MRRISAVVATCALVGLSLFLSGNFGAAQGRPIHNRAQHAGSASRVALSTELSKLGITYSPLPNSALNRSKLFLAKERIHSSFDGFLRGKPAESQLVSFTDSTYGNVTQSGSVDPYYVDQRAIMMVYPDQAVAPSYPHGRTGPATILSEFVAFVDPDTGRLLRAVAFNQ